MKRLLIVLVFGVCVGFLVAFAVYSDASYTSQGIRFNNQNWFTLPHPKVAGFTVEHDGNAYGFTDTGVSFVQYNVANEYGIRIQRFEIQDHYHYIIDGEVAYTPQELSVKLAEAVAQRG